MGNELTFGEMIISLKAQGLKNDSIIEHYEVKVKKEIGEDVYLFPIDAKDISQEMKRISSLSFLTSEV